MTAMPAWTQDLTEQQLRSAWARVRKPGWPETFELAMDDSFYSRLVASAAKHPPKAPQLAVVRHPWPFMAAPYIPKPPAPPAVFDIKRAAAGDRDD